MGNLLPAMWVPTSTNISIVVLLASLAPLEAEVPHDLLALE
jgi:hypothetical protein